VDKDSDVDKDSSRRLLGYIIGSGSGCSASYVGRILKGENPADLPVQAATKYKLVIPLLKYNEDGESRPHCLAK